MVWDHTVEGEEPGNTFFYRAGDEGKYDICYDPASIIGCTYDIFEAVCKSYGGACREIVRMCTGGLPRNLRTHMEKKALDKFKKRNEQEKLAKARLERRVSGMVYECEVRDDGGVVWFENGENLTEGNEDWDIAIDTDDSVSTESRPDSIDLQVELRGRDLTDILPVNREVENFVDDHLSDTTLEMPGGKRQDGSHTPSPHLCSESREMHRREMTVKRP